MRVRGGMILPKDYGCYMKQQQTAPHNIRAWSGPPERVHKSRSRLAPFPSSVRSTISRRSTRSAADAGLPVELDPRVSAVEMGGFVPRGAMTGVGFVCITLDRSRNPWLCRMTEPPFVPRERLFKHQQYFRNVPKQTYLKGRYDVITSVAIPLVLAGTSLFLIGRGIYNMSHGIGKKE
ncbi:hypothetical protein E2562_011438 [Oryza meyeriana var. granulata]|uniref:Uncharacterized protein n=1 Tax=Oryza meyeriana var. granulata TaxID=110450 RepID=A0A6G1D272_9ORYZ|nr:hypothetical protein E2562_011438 [Oryza meyeriana var. granulata]